MSRLHAQALQEQALSKKTKELVALATAIASGCDTSIAYHLHNALEAGATQREIIETLDVAIVTMGEPAPSEEPASCVVALSRGNGGAPDQRGVPATWSAIGDLCSCWPRPARSAVTLS